MRSEQKESQLVSWKAAGSVGSQPFVGGQVASTGMDDTFPPTPHSASGDGGGSGGGVSGKSKHLQAT